MLNMMNKVLSFLCCVIISMAPVMCYADDRVPDTKLVTTLDKGKKAPFSGILLSEPAAARLFADIKFSKKECDALLAEKLELSKIRYEAQIDSLKLKIDVEKERAAGLIAVRDDRINFLEKNYRPPAWYESQEFWFAVGIVAGVGLTAAAGYAIGQAK